MKWIYDRLTLSSTADYSIIIYWIYSFFFFFSSIIPYDDLTGSNGIPRRRVLNSDYKSNKIYFSSVSFTPYDDNDDGDDYNYDYDDDDDEELCMDDVVEVRTGLDIDPSSPLKALELAATAGKYLEWVKEWVSHAVFSLSWCWEVCARNIMHLDLLLLPW